MSFKGFIKSWLLFAFSCFGLGVVARHLTRHNVVVGASKNIMPMEAGISFFAMWVVVCFFPMTSNG